MGRFRRLREAGFLLLILVPMNLPSQGKPAGPEGTAAHTNEQHSILQKGSLLACASEKQNETHSTFCSFLIENYSTIQKTCGLAPARSWLPWTWFRKADPAKAIPSHVLNAIGSEAPGEKIWASDLPSLSRLMSTVSEGTGADAIMSLRGSASVGNVLHLDPVLSPEIMLVQGEASAVHTLSCSDILAAALSAGVALSVVKASAKIASEADTETTYNLVYGVFESPMFFMAETESWHQTYYFEALDWYLRSLAAGKTPTTTWAINPGPAYIKSGRGIVIYSTLKNESTQSGDGSANGQFALPFLSIEGSASDNATSRAQIKTRAFHMILGDVITANLPAPKQTGEYLSNAHLVHSLKSPAYDPDTRELVMSVAVIGMPSSLCSESVWGLVGDSKAAPHLKLESARYDVPSRTSNTPARSRSQCEFKLSADADATSDFVDALTPVAPGLPDEFSVRLGFNVRYHPISPKLRLLHSVASNSNGNEGDSWYEISADDAIDKSRDPDAQDVHALCGSSNTDVTQNVTRVASFTSLYNGIKGKYLQVHVALPSSHSFLNCHLGGSVSFTGQNGAPVKALINGDNSKAQTGGS